MESAVDPLSFLVAMAPNLATELTMWLHSKSSGGTIEQALRKTEAELQPKLSVDIYEALCWWCQSSEFKRLVETLTTSPQGSFEDLERAFIEHTKLSTPDAKRVVSTFVLNLKDALFQAHPSLTDSRSKVRDDEILKAILMSDAKADAKSERLMDQIGELLKVIAKSSANSPDEGGTTTIQNASAESADKGDGTDWLVPYWGKESFTDFMAAADENVKISVSSFPYFAEKLKRLHYLSESLNTFLSKRGRVFGNLFFFRAHSSVLGAARVGMGGQIAESYTLSLAAIHETLLGFYLFKNPKDAAVYSYQNENQSNKERARGRFTLSKMRAFLKREKTGLDGIADSLIATTRTLGDITSGAGAATILEIGPNKDWTIVYLQHDDLRYMATMKTIAQIQVFRMLVAGLIYPEFLQMDGIEAEINDVAVGL